MKDSREYIFMWSTTPIMPTYWATPMVFFSDNNIYPQSTLFAYFNGEVITAYMLKDEIEQHKANEGDKYLDPAYYKKYVARFEEDISTWWNWIRQIEKKDYANVSKEELQEDIHQFILYQRDAISYFGSTRPEFTYAAEQKLESILKKYVDDWADAFGVLTTSIEKDDIQRELTDWSSVDTSSAQAMLAHASKYPWLVFGQFDEEKVLNFLRNREIDYHDSESLVEKQEEILGQLGEDQEEVRYLAKFLQEQGVRRMDIKAYWAGSYYLARNLWKKVARELGVELSDLLGYITPPEIEQMLVGEFDQNLEEVLRARKQAHAILYEPGFDEIKILTGEEAKKEFDYRIKPVEETSELTGQVASLGVARGKVRKVLAGDLDELQKNIDLFQAGEILVTSMTQPNMMVLANRAAAIVTDEGGITSHAAIIARELKIPCIVGCQVAMEILEDGMEVEVDAKNGLVKIL